MTKIVAGDSTLRIVTHQQGSWKWQTRFALVQYVAVPRKCDGVLIWKSDVELNGKLAHTKATTELFRSTRHGSAHNHPCDQGI